MRLLAHRPVATVHFDMQVTPITTAAWQLILASLPSACCAVEISNPSGATMMISTGSPGQEGVSPGLIPYTILPGGSSILMPLEIARLLPISIKAVDQNANSGIFTLNFLG